MSLSILLPCLVSIPLSVHSLPAPFLCLSTLSSICFFFAVYTWYSRTFYAWLLLWFVTNL
jgi:hypothetical protein